MFWAEFNRCLCGHSGWEHDKNTCRKCECQNYKSAYERVEA